jgi:predicted lipid-binding transport protein (Tim44 family)
MDILAGMLAYVAGIGALFAGLVVSFFVLFATPQEPLQTQTQPQSASAMLVRPSAPNKPAAVEAHATQSAAHSEKQVAAAGSPGTAQPAAFDRDFRHKPAAAAAQARRLIHEERARRWAYQQDSSFKSRFLGYAD